MMVPALGPAGHNSAVDHARAHYSVRFRLKRDAWADAAGAQDLHLDGLGLDRAHVDSRVPLNSKNGGRESL